MWLLVVLIDNLINIPWYLITLLNSSFTRPTYPTFVFPDHNLKLEQCKYPVVKLVSPLCPFTLKYSHDHHRCHCYHHRLLLHHHIISRRMYKVNWTHPSHINLRLLRISSSTCFFTCCVKKNAY